MKKLILTTAEWLYLKWILERNMIRMDADAFRLKEGEPGSEARREAIGKELESIEKERRNIEWVLEKIKADIEYGFFYLTGISGKGKGEAGAKASARVFNQLHPFLIGPNMLTIYPESDLYQEIQNGNWEEESEIEKYQELRTLVENLNIPTYLAAAGL